MVEILGPYLLDEMLSKIAQIRTILPPVYLLALRGITPCYDRIFYTRSEDITRKRPTGSNFRDAIFSQITYEEPISGYSAVYDILSLSLQTIFPLKKLLSSTQREIFNGVYQLRALQVTDSYSKKFEHAAR